MEKQTRERLQRKWARIANPCQHAVGFRKEWSWANGGKTYVDYIDEYEGYRAGNIFDHHIRGASRLSHPEIVKKVIKGVGVNIPVWNQILVP